MTEVLEGGGSGPDEYLVNAEVLENTLNIYKNDGSVIEFTAQGGSSYTAGLGIKLDNDVISIDGPNLLNVEIEHAEPIEDITYKELTEPTMDGNFGVMGGSWKTGDNLMSITGQITDTSYNMYEISLVNPTVLSSKNGTPVDIMLTDMMTFESNPYIAYFYSTSSKQVGMRIDGIMLVEDIGMSTVTIGVGTSVPGKSVTVADKFNEAVTKTDNQHINGQKTFEQQVRVQSGSGDNPSRYTDILPGSVEMHENEVHMYLSAANRKIAVRDDEQSVELRPSWVLMTDNSGDFSTETYLTPDRLEVSIPGLGETYAKEWKDIVKHTYQHNIEITRVDANAQTHGMLTIIDSSSERYDAVRLKEYVEQNGKVQFIGTCHRDTTNAFSVFDSLVILDDLLKMSGRRFSDNYADAWAITSTNATVTDNVVQIN